MIKKNGSLLVFNLSGWTMSMRFPSQLLVSSVCLIEIWLLIFISLAVLLYSSLCQPQVILCSDQSFFPTSSASFPGCNTCQSCSQLSSSWVQYTHPPNVHSIGMYMDCVFQESSVPLGLLSVLSAMVLAGKSCSRLFQAGSFYFHPTLGSLRRPLQIPHSLYCTSIHWKLVWTYWAQALWSPGSPDLLQTVFSHSLSMSSWCSCSYALQ